VSTLVSRSFSACVVVSGRTLGSKSSVVTSWNRMPFFGKSGTCRMESDMYVFLSSSMLLCGAAATEAGLRRSETDLARRRPPGVCRDARGNLRASSDA